MSKSNKLNIFQLIDEAATEKCAASFVQELLSKLKTKSESPLIVFLQGELGAGKTTFVRGFLRCLGYIGKVKSPTYTLVEEYKFPDIHLSISHFDLYRLRQPEELDEMGFREYLKAKTIVFIEWPELGGSLLPKPDYTITLQHTENGESRECTIKSYA